MLKLKFILVKCKSAMFGTKKVFSLEFRQLSSESGDSGQLVLENVDSKTYKMFLDNNKSIINVSLDISEEEILS